MTQTTALIEQIDLSESQPDTDARVLRGVVLIREGMSKNRRRYSGDVLQKAAPLFEGIKAYTNHDTPGAKGARSMRDLSGWYANVSYREGKLTADRYFTETQAGQDAWAIAKDIVTGRAPKSLAGLSINAVGSARVVKEDGGDVVHVESINGAISVDDVSEAAAGGTYIESADSSDLTTMLLSNLTFEEWFAANPAYTKRVQNEMKTVRQDEALKAAKAEAEQIAQALHEAQAEIDALKAESARLLEFASSKARELAIEKALKSVSLPARQTAHLRERLEREADTAQWTAIIENELQFAKDAGYGRPQVVGAGQQVYTPPESTKPVNPLPMPGENADTWARRVGQQH